MELSHIQTKNSAPMSSTITLIWNSHWIATLRDPNGIASDNVILDTRMYEVEYADGYKTAMTANNISSNLFAQVDQDGKRFVLFDEILDHRKDGS